MLGWLFEPAVTLKGERAARVSWTAHLKNNPKTLNHPHLLPSYQIPDIRPIAQAGDEMVKSQFLPYGAWRHGTAHGALERWKHLIEHGTLAAMTRRWSLEYVWGKGPNFSPTCTIR